MKITLNNLEISSTSVSLSSYSHCRIITDRSGKDGQDELTSSILNCPQYLDVTLIRYSTNITISVVKSGVIILLVDIVKVLIWSELAVLSVIAGRFCEFL